MATPTAIFPGAIATAAQLKVANNLIQSTMRVAADAVNTILFVSSVAGFGPNMLVSIDKEIIAISGVQTSPNAALLVASGGRGFDGTAAAPHAAGAKVSVLIDAWHHNVLSTEITAIETALGPNLQNIGRSVDLISTDFAFAAQTPGGTLSPGSNTITLAPVPKGVNGTDQNHYLYISGGTGTAEAVLITGGTAVSGAASGTVIVTCALAHSGAWMIQTATAGIQEALLSVGANAAAVRIPTGPHSIFAPVHIAGSGQFVRGSGIAATTLYVIPTGPANVFEWVGPSPGSTVGGGLEDLSIVCPNSGGVASKSGGWGLVVTNQSYFTVRNVAMFFPPNGIQANTSGHFFDTIQIINIAPTTGIGVQINGPGAPLNYMNDLYVEAANGSASLNVTWADYLTILNSNFVGANYGLLANPGGGHGIVSMDVIGTYFDNNLVTGALLQPVNGGYIFRSRFTHCWTSSSHTGDGLRISTAGDGYIDGLSFTHHQSILNFTDGVVIQAGAGAAKNIVFDGLLAGGNNAGGGGFGAVRLSSNMFNVQISNSILGAYGNLPSVQAYGLKIELGIIDGLMVTSNNLQGNTAAIVDAGGGVAPHRVIQGNLGIDDQIATIASAAAITLSGNSTITITGAAMITTINGGWTGRTITLIFTGASPGGTGTGGNIGRTLPAAQNQAIRLTFNGTTWY